MGGGGCYLKLDVQGQRGGKMLDVDGQGGVLKIGQFSWTSYVYHSLDAFKCYIGSLINPFLTNVPILYSPEKHQKT